MRRILIVDDEHFVRMGIKSNLDWEAEGYTIAGEAESGPEAIVKIMSLNPEIVFLDITMPGKDGLEVLREVREQGYTGFVVMLTCHEEFRMVQNAMRLGANDYVLKNEMTGSYMLEYLNRIPVSENDKEKEKQYEDERDRQTELTYYRHNFLKNALRFGGIGDAEFEKSNERYGVQLRKGPVYLLLISIKKLKTVLQRYEGGNSQVLFHAIEHMIEECLKNVEESEFFWMDANQLVILLTFSREVSELKIHEVVWGVIQQMNYSFSMFLNIETVIACSRYVGGFMNINEGYEEVEKLQEQSFFYPNQSIFMGHDYKNDADISVLENELCGEMQEETSICERLEQYLEENKKEKQRFSRKKMRHLLNRFIIQSNLKNEISWNLNFEDCEDITGVMEQLKDYESTVKALKEADSHTHMISQALKLIHEELEQDITLEGIAERLSVSPSYFSRTFSREMEQTFSSYVIEKRIEKAKTYITTTNLKFYEIAELCGFHSSVHFNNMFKKICGVTPNQYRNDSTKK